MDVKEITTIEKLKETFPQLAKQLADTAAESARSGVDIETPKTEAAAAETDRVLGLAKVHFGQEAADKFSAVVKGGVTVDQYQAMADALGRPDDKQNQPGKGQENPPAASDADENFRQNMQKGIENADAPDVGAGGGPGKGPQTWDQAVSAIQAEDNCTRMAAMKKAYKQYPELHKKYLEEANKQGDK